MRIYAQLLYLVLAAATVAGDKSRSSGKKRTHLVSQSNLNMHAKSFAELISFSVIKLLYNFMVRKPWRDEICRGQILY